jgi:hypothetical protein
MLTSNAARMSFRSGCCRGATGVHARRANLALFGQWPPVRVNLSEPSAPASAEPGASIPNIPRRRVTWRLHQRAVQLYLVRFGHPSVRPARFRRPRFHLTQLKTRRVAKLIRARSGTRAPLFLGRSSALRPTSSRAGAPRGCGARPPLAGRVRDWGAKSPGKLWNDFLRWGTTTL